MDILNMILPIVYIVVGVALIWFVVEMALTIRKTRSTVEDVQKQIEPTLANVEQLTNDAKPLVERVSLTVDAANLEIMRVDEILQDVSSITGTASKTVNAVDNVTSAPLDLVNSFTNKMRDKFSPKRASDISKEIGEAKAESSESASEVASADADTNSSSEEVAVDKPTTDGYIPIDAQEEVTNKAANNVFTDGN